MITSINGSTLDQYIEFDRISSKDSLIEILNKPANGVISNTILTLTPLALRINVDFYRITKDNVIHLYFRTT